jgi:Oxidoreductase family, NAD-binding Rossmann fold
MSSSRRKGISRRGFIRSASYAAAVAGLARMPSLKAMGYQSPNEKLNIAGIGAGGQAFRDLEAARGGVENIVALADVDWVRAKEGFDAWPQARRFRDYREMLDKMGKEIDAVVIAIPDHNHAAAALACMQAGKHVYLEKPLTRTPWEARFLTQAAAKYDVATQMGNQGYSHEATRVACEILWSGEIGEVREVHAWTRSPSWPQEMTRIPDPTPVPETLDWDLWLGTAEDRPFTAGDEEYRAFADGQLEGRRYGGEEFGFYLPFNWRGFYDFGSSLIGDWGVHILGPANWGLQLSPESLLSVECIEKSSLPPFTFPWKLTVKYEFGPRPGMPPVTVYWYHHGAGEAYLPPGMSVEEARKIPGEGPDLRPGANRRRRSRDSAGAEGQAAQGDRPRPGGFDRGAGYNCIFVGSQGYLGTNGRGEDVGLLPGSRWAEYELPRPYLSRSPGANSSSNHQAHCNDWVRACKGGAPACSSFEVAGKYTEWLLLGAAAVHFDGKLEWDAAKGEITNVPEANRWVKPTYRKGWELKL